MGKLKRKKCRKIAAAIIGLFLIGSGIFFKYKREMLSKENITGLCFHNPEKKVFYRCIKWLKDNNCNFISTDELIKIMAKEINPPRRAVWLTFDDGWKENIKNALPIIEKYKLPVTFFVSTAAIQSDGFFWFTLVRRYQKYLPYPYNDKVRLLWSISEAERRTIVNNLKKVRLENLNKSVLPKLFGEGTNRLEIEAMRIKDIAYLSSLPFITIGAHTVNHVITPNCTADELDIEVNESKKVIESWTNKQVFSFAYPNGDYNNLVRNFLFKEGFKIATTTEKKFITKDNDPLLIPRFCINDDALSFETKCQIVGAWGSLMEKIKLNKTK